MTRPEPLRRRLRARALAALALAAGVLPEPCVRAGLALVARLLARGPHGRRTRENLSRVFAHELSASERAALASRVFAHDARLVAEWLRLAGGAAPDSRRGRWIEERVRIAPSIRILDEALAEGRGAIVVTAHIGNWELLAAALRRRGLRGRVIGFQRRRDSSSDWLLRMRASYGVGTLPQDTSAREAVRVLAQGEILGLLCDLEARRLDGMFLPFLGCEAFVMTAPAALARASRSPLIPVSCLLESPPDGGPAGYVLRVEAPLVFDRELPREQATRELLLELGAVFERWIRSAPEQWAWHQPRWRMRADAEPTRATTARGAQSVATSSAPDPTGP